jgi:hypothetical protein
MATKNLLFSLPVHITKQGKRFVAYTPALDISTSGKSEKEVKVRFTEIVALFLEEIMEAGTINDVLSELGWKKEQKKWTPPRVISSQHIGFNIPVLV